MSGTPIDSLPEYDPSMDSQQMEEEFTEMSAPAPRAQGRQFQGPSVEATGYAQGGRGRGGNGRARGNKYVKDEQFVGSENGFGSSDWKSYILQEGKVPLIAAVIYFILNMNVVDVQLLKYIPKLFTRDCEINMNGIIFKAALMGVSLMIVNHFVQ